MVVEPMQRKPYIVGDMVRGEHFYGRTALLNTVLNGTERAVWVVGARRSGKTSLLYRLEEMSNARGEVAFCTSMDASNTIADFVEWWIDDLDENDERLTRLGLSVADLRGKGLHDIFRMLNRNARERKLHVLLLLDEGEALVTIAQNEGDAFLKNTRRVLERCEALRVVFAATKGLAALDDVCRAWDTTTFLDAVTLRYLEPMPPDESAALIRQTQSAAPLTVDDTIVNAIIQTTCGHPYLTAWLCSRVWDDNTLRVPTVEDLTLDTTLIDLFQQDYRYLAEIERRILRALADVQMIDAETLTAIIGQQGATLPAVQLRYLMTTLAQLGYVRTVDGKYAAGNQLLQHWLQFHDIAESDPLMTDRAAVDQADPEQQRVSALITANKRRLAVREEQQATMGINTPPEIVNEIKDIRATLSQLEGELAGLRMGRSV